MFPDNAPGDVAADDNDPAADCPSWSAASPSAADPSAADPSAADSSAGNSPPGIPSAAAWDAGSRHSYGWQWAGHMPKPGSGSGAASAAGDDGQPPWKQRSTTPRPSWKKDTAASDYGDHRSSASAAGTNMEDIHMPTAIEIIRQLDIDGSAMQASCVWISLVATKFRVDLDMCLPSAKYADCLQALILLYHYNDEGRSAAIRLAYPVRLKDVRGSGGQVFKLQVLHAHNAAR